MKQKFKWLLALVAMVASVNLFGAEETYTWTLASGDFGSAGTPQTSVTKGSPNIQWNVAYTWGGSSATMHLGWDNSKGVQIGSGSSTNKCSSLVLTTSGISGDISAIKVNASHASSGGASIASIKVNGVSYYKDGGSTATSVNCSTSASEYTFKPKNNGAASSGEVVITISNSANKAIYLKSIKIDYKASKKTDVYVSAEANGSIKAYSDADCTSEIAISNHKISVDQNSTVYFKATPNTGFVVNSWTGATADPSDNTKASLAVGTAEATVSVSFKAPASHDITWYANGQQFAQYNQQEGAALTIPSDPDPDTYCYGKTFVGWTTTSTVATDGTGITYVKTGDKVGSTTAYYAVFADEGELVEKTLEWAISSSNIAMTDESQTSGYSKYAGDQTIDGITINLSNVMITDKAEIQFKKNSDGVLYNKTSFGKITKIEITGAELSVFEGSSVITSKPSSGAKSASGTSPYTYNCSGNNGFFYLTNTANNVVTPTEISVSYKTMVPSYSNYVTSCAAPTESYTVSFDTQGKGTAPAAITEDGPGEGVTLPNITDATGYSLVGWATTVEKAIAGTADAGKAEEIFNPKDNCTLFAVWEAKKTTVHFNFNLGKDAGGTAIEPDNEPTQSVTATYDAAMPSIKVLPQKEGKIFIGYLDKDVEKYYYNADGESQCVWDKDAKNATIYAQWQDKEAVTVSFADNMHENTIPTINTYSGETFTFPAALADQTPVAGTCQGEHSHFMGWVKTSDEITDANIHTAGSTSGTLTGNESYLAVWAKVEEGGEATYTLVSSADNFADGTYVIAALNSNTYYFVNGECVNAGLSVEETGLATSKITNNSFSASDLPANAVECEVTDDGEPIEDDHYYFIKYTSETDTYYMDDNGSGGDLTWTTNTLVYTYHPNFTQNSSSNGCVLLSISGTKVSQNGSTKASYIRNYKSSGSFYNDIYFFKKSDGITYSDYLTECCQGYNVTLANEGVATGGTFEANPTTACAGDVVTLTASKATGYSFSSWSVEGATPESATAETTTIQMPASDVTVNATFTPNKHNVVFTKNDGSATVSTQEVEFGVAENLNTNVFTWTNHTFNGWALSPTGNVAYEEGASFTLDEDNDVSLYAIWTADDAVAVSLFGTEHLSDITAPSSISQALTSFTFNYTVNTGYKITGVTVKVGETTLTASEVAYTATGIIITPAAGDFSAGAVSITFTVEEILYTVTLNPGSGTCAQTELTQEHYGSAVTLPTPTIAADGWAFAGWAAAKVETETESAPTLYTSTYTPAEDLTLYAVYKRGEEVESTTEKYACDFEGTSAPTGWSFTNFSCTNSDVITPHTGSKWGSIASKSNSYVTFNTELTGKYKITAYVARTSGNNDNSTFSIKSSANNWGKVLGSSINVGNSSLQTDTWYELSWTGDLSNEKVEIFYTSSTTAVRALDDITIVKIIEKNYYHSTPSVLTSLTVSKKLAKNTNYKVGEVFNPEGIELQAIYDNDESTAEPITEGFDYEPKTALAAGVTTITLTYKKATCTLDVTAGTLDHISITTKPSKLDYVEGECFSNASLVTRAYYKYNDAEICSEALKKDVDLTYSPSLTTPLTTNDTYVRISYTWAGTTVYVDQPITVIGKVATPTFDPAGGKLSGETPITISCATEGASIFYTTDGSDPTINSKPYTTPVPMTGGTLKAIATAENMGQSEVGKAVFIETIDPTNGDWMLVTDVNDLAEGDYLIIASNAKGWVAGKTEGTNLAHITTTFSDDKSILTYTADAMMFRLGGETGAWTLTNVDKEHLMGATAEKKLSWDNGTTTWSIAIEDDNNATIQNGSDYGRMLDNTGNYFTTYKSATSSSMLLPQLYKYYKKVPKLIYDANGGTNAPVPTRSKNGVATVTDKTPTWGGYEFVKWTADKEGKGKEYTAGEEVAITADLTIYAQWQEKQLEGTPVALVVKYNDKFYAMGKDLSAVEVEGIYNGNVVVVSEEIDQKSITWYRNDVEGGVTFQNCEEMYLYAGGSTKLSIENTGSTWVWTENTDKQCAYYEANDESDRTFFLQGTEVFKNYAVSNISSNASAATCCTGFRVGKVFTRDMSNGFMGTHCYPFDIAAGDYTGAQFYEIAYRIGDTRIYFDQVDHVEAGVPYLVVPEDEENGSVLEAIVTPKNVDASNKNGFYGSYEQKDLDANSGLYIVYNNEFRLAGNYVAVGANRAYIKLAEVETNDPQQGAATAPRRISLRNSNAQSPTGIDNVVAEFGDSKESKKVIINGNFYIINQGKVYGAQGQLVK